MSDPHRWWLAVTLCVLLAVVACDISEDGQHVHVRGAHWRLPEACVVRQWCGWRCPGCGVTRSLIALRQADWQYAYQLNPTGFAVALVLVWQLIYRPWCLWRRAPSPLGDAIHVSLLGIVSLMLSVQAVLRGWENS